MKRYKIFTTILIALLTSSTAFCSDKKTEKQPSLLNYIITELRGLSQILDDGKMKGQRILRRTAEEDRTKTYEENKVIEHFFQRKKVKKTLRSVGEDFNKSLSKSLGELCGENSLRIVEKTIALHYLRENEKKLRKERMLLRLEQLKTKSSEKLSETEILANSMFIYLEYYTHQK